MHDPVIYFRSELTADAERSIAEEFFPVVTCRTQVSKGALCIPRYSALPFYRELEEDMDTLGARLINSYSQHRYAANLGNWYRDLEGLTPQTWNRIEQIPEEGPFILKGETNSKKFSWDSHFYAADKQAAIEVFCRLQDDTFLSDQEIFIRKYVNLHRYMTGLRGLPVTKEFRVFICDGQVLTAGYYWSNYLEDLGFTPDPAEIPQEFLQEVIDRVGKNIRFWVVDVAQTAEGGWIVIELNDGCMSGLSECDPRILYRKLREVL